MTTCIEEEKYARTMQDYLHRRKSKLVLFWVNHCCQETFYRHLKHNQVHVSDNLHENNITLCSSLDYLNLSVKILIRTVTFLIIQVKLGNAHKEN